MKKKLSIILSAMMILLAAMTVWTSGDAAFWLKGKAVTYESSKPEAAKKKKNKKKKTTTAESNDNAKSDDKSDSSKTSDGSGSADTSKSSAKSDDGVSVDEDGTYTSKDEVAAYIHAYGHLPSNFITKKEAKALGWVSNQGNLGEVAPGKSIGGDYFGNYEGQLPEKKGRSYYECDIDSTGGYRGAKRIIYSSDGLIFYTEDHYNTFEQLY